MNLFCVGLSHHTADVEARERFAGRAETDRVLRGAGCAEALVLTTCNRVEVYGASEKRVSTAEIAHCLLRKTDMTDNKPHQYAVPFYRYEDARCVQHLFGLLQVSIRWWLARLKFSARRKRRTNRRELQLRSGRIFTACSSVPFGLRSRFARALKLRAARYRWAPWRLTLPRKFLASSAFAKSLCLVLVKQASVLPGRLFLAGRATLG